MEDQISAALVASMSADENTRVSAEAQLTQGGTQPGFGLALTKVALNQQGAVPGTRQLAAVVLKKYIKEHWQAGEGRFFPPQVSDEEKAGIRELLPMGLGDPSGKIRTACGMAIATICVWDWPQAWPALTGILIGALRERTSEDTVIGALRCLAMIAGDLEEGQVPTVVPLLFPELLQIVTNVHVSLSVKRRALAVMHSVLLTLGMMSGARQRAVRDLMNPLLPGWLEVFSVILDPSSFKLNQRPISSNQCGVLLETLRCLTQVTSYFSKTAGEALLPPLSRAAALFHAMAPMYANAFVATHGNARAFDDARDSDGDTLSLETVVAQVIELVMALVEHPWLSAVVAPGLDDTVYQALGYMCMTSDQEESWRHDSNQYVADEDDDVSTVRAMCGLLLDELCDRFGTVVLSSLQTACARRLIESGQLRSSGDPDWWKGREATMLAVGVVADFALDAEQAAAAEHKQPAFVTNEFLQSVLTRELSETNNTSAGNNSFLTGRALWVAAKLAPGALPSAALAVLAASVKALAPNAEAPLRVGACRALAQYIPVAPKTSLAPLLGAIYQGLGGLLESHEQTRAAAEAAQNASTAPQTAGFDSDDDDSLHLVLEAMLVVVRADDDAAVPWSTVLAPTTLRLWAGKVSDPLLSATARDVLEALANNPKCLPGLLMLAVPTLASIIQNPQAQPPMLVESSLDVMCVLLRPAPSGGESARACHAACFAAVVQLALTSDDVGVLQSAAECLRAFLRSGGEASLAWGVDGSGGGSGASGDVLRSYLDAAARLLSCEMEEGASVFAAPLLGQMLRRLPFQMRLVVPEVVVAVVSRARNAKQPNLVAALVPILARLVHSDTDALVQMLASTPAPPFFVSQEHTQEKEEGSDGVPPATNALDTAMRLWVTHQADVQGAFDIKITVTALALLLASANSAATLGAVVVRGKPVVTETGDVPRTRSRAKAAGPEQFVPTPVSVVILELLADAILEIKEANQDDGVFDRDEDDEWEDDEDADDEFDGDGGSGGKQSGGGGGLFGGDLLERLMDKGIDDGYGDDDADEKEDPLGAICVETFLKERMGATHQAGRLVPLATGLDSRRQQALMTLLS